MNTHSPFFQAIARILVAVMVAQPLHGIAADIKVDKKAGGNTKLTSAQNGVPVVNIATPNGKGLSHNKFTDYNVDQQGLILNNSPDKLVETQLGGIIFGNSRLNGKSATTILNEVTGGQRSQLRGYTEVAGKKAHVIVANPHGITCDGCGFINTPHATLTTGKPMLEDGKLRGYDVEGGDIEIAGAGLNASNISRFDLITRSAKINAELYANELNIITGRNQVESGSLTATAKAESAESTASKPLLAIDSSALGGMYAGAIRLVGTEAGVGVKLAADMAASAGDIQIDANGKLTLARVSAAHDLHINVAQDVELTQQASAGSDITVAAAQLDNRGGKLVGQQSMTLAVHDLNNATGTLASDGQLTVQAKGQVNNNGGLMLSQSGDLAVTGQSIDNRDGLLQANTGAVRVTAQQTLNNHAGQIVATQNNLHLSGGTIDNDAGALIGQANLDIDAQSVSNRSGMLGGQKIAINLAKGLNNESGLIEAAEQLWLNTGSVDNRGGSLRALGQAGSSIFNINTAFDNDRGLVEIGNQAFAINSQSLTNRDGVVRHLGDQFLLNLDDIGQAGGSFFTNGRLSLNLDRWTNNSELQARQIELNVNHFVNDAAGVVRSIEDLQASGNSWVNHGRIETDGSLSLALTGGYAGRGLLHSQGDLNLSATSATLQQGASVRSAANASFELGGRFQNKGVLSAVGNLQVRAHELENQGTLGAGQWMGIRTNQLLNQGLIFSGADMSLRSHGLTNLRGDIYSLGALSIAKNDALAAMNTLENLSGSIESASNMRLYADSLINRKENFRLGKELVYGNIDVTCYDCSGDHHNVDYVATERFKISIEEDSPAARIHAGGELSVQGDRVANHYSTISASGNISIVARMLENLAASTGTVQRVQRFNTGRITDGTDERFRWYYIIPYNAQPLPKKLPTELKIWRLVSDIETETATGVAAPAIIQAGGDIDIKTDETLSNASLLKYEAPAAGISQDVDTRVASGSQPLVVQLNAQLPPDLGQQALDPTALPAFALPGTPGGLFAINTQTSHPYLIETNPLFASMSNFLNSGYMLAALGYDPDQAQKRLGDGLYEQRLIEQAITARTGKRFLDGLTSNDAQFRYLMDNAIASKDALNLSVGISLTAEQVAALTHDIVWLEEREIQGENVLVPVVYLAQATDRVAATGALIQGQDLTLISGAELENSGVLRASNSLTAYAERISNTGLIQADGRLDLLAQDSIHNQRGGLITGQDVSLLAVTGDIINERSITEETRSGHGFSQTTSIVDRAAGIEATGDLALSAGRDLINQGADLKAGAAMELSAGRNVLLVSAEENHGQMRQDKRHFWSSNSTTQHAGNIEAGTQLTVSAGEDIAVVASRVQSGGDMHLQAGGDVLISAAANTHSSEYRYRRSGKKVNQEDTQVRQQASVLGAGGEFVSVSGADTQLVSSQISSGREAYLIAGGKVQLLAEQDVDYSFYEKTKKGSFGRKSYRMNESDSSNAVVSSIQSGADAVIYSDEDIIAHGASLEAGGKFEIHAANDIQLLAAENSTATASAKSKRNLVSSKAQTGSKSSTEVVGTSVHADSVQIVAGRNLSVAAGDLRADGDMLLYAGEDLELSSQQQYSSQSQSKQSSKLGFNHHALFTHTQKQQAAEQGSGTAVGTYVGANNLAVGSGQDISIIGSTLISDNDMHLSAGRNLNIASAQDITYSDHLSRTVSKGEIGKFWAPDTGRGVQNTETKVQSVKQQGSTLQAAGKFTATTGQDLSLTSSHISAGDDAKLLIGGKVELIAGQNVNQSNTVGSSRSSFGGKGGKLDENAQIEHVGSSITSGDGNVSIISGDSQLYQAAMLDSGGDLILGSGGNIVFEGVLDLEQSTKTSSKNSWLWRSAKGKGKTDETLVQSKLQARGAIVIDAVDGLQIDIKKVNEQSVNEAIDAMVKADPQLAWLKDMQQRGDVDWRQVKEVHDSFSYSDSGLGGAAAIVIAIVVAYFTAGAASTAIGNLAGGAGSGAMAAGTATTSAGWGNIALSAAAGSAASNTAIGTINNNGDLAAGLREATSSDNLTGTLIAGVTAGLTAGVYDNWTSTQTGVGNTGVNGGIMANSGKVVVDGGLSTWNGVGQFAANQALQNVTSAGLSKVLGQDASFGDALTNTLANTFAAAGFNWVGDFSQNNQIENGSLSKIGLHAIMGGLAAEAAGGDFKSGALVAGANEALIDSLASQYESMTHEQRSGLLTMNSQVLGVLVAAMAGGDEKDMQTGAWVAGNATNYNRQLHPDEIEFASDRERVQRYADEHDLSEDAARQELLRTAAALVDRGWNEALTEADGKTERAAAFLESELAGHSVKMFQATPLEYNNERLGLIELFNDKQALHTLLTEVALVDPLDYKTNPQYYQEVLNAKGLGSQEGFGNAIEGLASAPSKTALWLMGAANCPDCALTDIQQAWDAVASLPEELKYKGYLDNLHIMQGKGFEVVKGNAASSTELGVDVGFLIAGGTWGGTKIVKSVDEILKPGGDFLGTVQKGATPNIRTVSSRDFVTLQGQILNGAKQAGTYSGGKGTWYELPGGGRVGVRTSDKSGTTLDIDIPGYPKGFKVHQQ